MGERDPFGVCACNRILQWRVEISFSVSCLSRNIRDDRLLEHHVSGAVTHCGFRRQFPEMSYLRVTRNFKISVSFVPVCRSCSTQRLKETKVAKFEIYKR